MSLEKHRHAIVSPVLSAAGGEFLKARVELGAAASSFLGIFRAARLDSGCPKVACSDKRITFAGELNESYLMMKLPNDNIRKKIIDEARESFERKSYLKTAMRDIAQRVGISAGNIYNYFASKDELFRAVVQPVIHSFHQMLEEHHGLESSSVTDMLSEDYLRRVTNEYVTMIRRQRTLLVILLFKAQGSSLAAFKEEYTDKATAQVKLWLNKEKARHGGMNIAVTDFFLHLHTVWMFTMIEEIIMHDIHGDDLDNAVNEYINFEISGWKSIFNI